MIAPERVAVSGFGRRRSLSDLAVWGFPETFPENLPPQALPTPFSPFFLPLDPSSNSFAPQTPPFNSLEQACISPFYPSLPSFFSFSPFLPLRPFLGPYRTSSEHLRNPSIGSLKGPKTALFRPFRGIPKNPQKGAKNPLFDPFFTPTLPSLKYQFTGELLPCHHSSASQNTELFRVLLGPQKGPF